MYAAVRGTDAGGGHGRRAGATGSMGRVRRDAAAGGRGRLCAGGRRLLCRGGSVHRAVLPAQKQRKPEKRRGEQARPTRTGGEKPMKKRILSILLLCCMLLTLLPTAAFAADTGKAIQLGTDALSKNVNTASAPTVYFGQDHENNPAAWRVIGYNGNGVASAQGDMTLLAAGNMSSVLQFADFGTNNRYASSYLKTAIDALAEKLTTEENTAVKKRTLTSGSYNGENTDCVAGEQVDNAVFWPLSTAEAFAVNQDLRIVDPEHPSWASSYWWLCSPGYSDHDAATVNGDGSVVYSGNAISSWWCVRPAFNLNSSSVLFTSAAVGGKPDGGLTPISKYTGNEWKLTLKDSNRNFAVTETTVSGDPGDTVTLHYTGATAGINEYISVILADNSGAQYYGRVAQPTAENGTVEIKIPSGLAPGSYTLKVFSEQCNDDKKTDYASDFVDIDLTVGYQEQFTLTPGGVYYFDLSGVSIPGTANGSLPDKTMHYVPFTYAGTVDAYKLTSEMATTEEYAQQNEYAHSLFVADYAVTHAVSWDDLNATGLIFGKGYATGSVDYTLRAPSGGSGGTGSGALERGTPQSNEWDRILDKDDGYIKNWRDIGSWGQDTLPNTLSNRVIRGRYDLPRKYAGANTTLSFPFLGFRPVLEVLNSDTLGSDGLKAVTLDLGGGKFGGSSDTIQIIVKTGESFTAPASDGLTRPDGNTGSYFEWLGSDGELYAPDDNVPADVTKLTAQFVPPEQFNLAPGGVYYFDLSGVGIPDTVNDALPDNTLHYVPFTYAGTVDAYALTSEMATTDEYAEKHKYPHSLFVADFAVTHTISWENLNAAGLIFGKNYTANSVEYTMRVPSAGRSYRGSGDSVRGNPQSNEWDKILDKYDGYIRNCNATDSWGQDVAHNWAQGRAMRGYSSVRNWNFTNASDSGSHLGFRPILEVLNPDTLKPNGLKAVALDLGGGKLGGSSDNIQIIVKNGSEFTAPASDGLTRPDGDTGSYFMWFGSDGNLYAPGESVSADVTKLTAQFEPSVYTVTITTDTLPDGKVGEAYSQTLSADGTTPITWSVENGDRPTGLSLNKDTGEISGTPTAAGTSTFTVKATNSAGSDTKELSITITKAAPAEYTVRFNANGGGGTMEDVTGVSGSYTLPACGFTEPEGKQFKGWSTSADGSVISSTTYEVSSDTTFYAIWESKEYSIIVTDGKATIGAGSEISKAAQGTTITLTANAAPDGKVFDKWVVESGNTTLEDANSETTTFIMPDSEVSVKATYTIPHTHTYDQEIQKPETLKSAADCTNDAVYFKSCSCGEISTTETFTAAGTQLGHAWASDWSKDIDNHWKECSRCHEKKDEAAHDYGSDNICDTCGYDKTVPHTHNLTLVPAKAPTCTEKGNTAYYTCDGCDKWFEDATGASEITDKTSVILAATGHSASDWKSDNTDHWKECTVVGCGVIIEGSKAAHTAGEWIIDTPATATTSGSKHKECTVCGYTMTIETIPATGGGEHTHSYGSDWKNDATNHWHECSCGDKADKAAHDFKWVVDKEATATQKGSKHEECRVCGYKKAAVEIPATGTPTEPGKPTDSDSPQTGDNSNMILWIALLFVSGGVVIGIIVYSKKKKENAE